MASATYALEVQPETALQFTLSQNEATPRCTMTLSHPGATDEHLAFKVKTTQPRRYLVRPNQGLVAPRSSETISILLVEKDKQLLLQSYERLGQSALDHSKDKFLVQSCAVSNQLAEKAGNGSSTELYEALTSMWNAVTSGGSNTPIYNKKLHVRHVVEATPGGGAAGSTSRSPIQPHDNSLAAIEKMTPEQLFSEISSLRRKYDELVSFSVNLTAERDILNNTLEQTKRDLNREMAARATLENKQGGGTQSARAVATTGSSMSLVLQLLVVAIAGFMAGVRMASTGQAAFLAKLPVVGGMFEQVEGETGEAFEPEAPSM